MRVIAIIIPKKLFTNLLLSLCFSFVKTKNKIQFFGKLMVWWQEMFLLFACSEPRSTSKACRIQWTFLKKVLFKKFFICYFCLYHSLMLPRNNKNGSRERIVVTINKFLKSQYSINVFHIMAHNSDFLITSNSLNMNLLYDDNFDFI